MTQTDRTGLALAFGVLGTALVARGWRAARRFSFNRRSVVIVGGSRGLGLVIARQLAEEGARLALVARDLEELERARLDVERHGGTVLTVTCDIRERLQAEKAIERIADEHAGIDVLINDAGVIQVGPIEHMAVSDFEDALATHFWGPLYTTLAALPHLRRSGAGRIVNISSIGGKIAVPHLVPYCASKFALTGLSEGLHAELAKDGIRVTTVCPGLMRTGSTYNASFKGQHRREFFWFHLSDSIPGLSIDARRAARKVIEACRHGHAELIITLPARCAVLLNAAFPGAFAQVMAAANRILPAPDRAGGLHAHSGWESVSRAAPSVATRLSDRAAVENNEIPSGAPA